MQFFNLQVDALKGAGLSHGISSANNSQTFRMINKNGQLEIHRPAKPGEDSKITKFKSREEYHFAKQFLATQPQSKALTDLSNKLDGYNAKEGLRLSVFQDPKNQQQVKIFGKQYQVPASGLSMQNLMDTVRGQAGLPEADFNKLLENKYGLKEVSKTPQSESKPAIDTNPPVHFSKGQFIFEGKPISVYQMITHPRLGPQIEGKKNELLKVLIENQKGVALLSDTEAKPPRDGLNKLKSIYNFFLGTLDFRKPLNPIVEGILGPGGKGLNAMSDEKMRPLRNLISVEINKRVVEKNGALIVFGSEIKVAGMSSKDASVELKKILHNVVIAGKSDDKDFIAGMKEAGIEPSKTKQTVYAGRFGKSTEKGLEQIYGNATQAEKQAIHIQYLGTQLKMMEGNDEYQVKDGSVLKKTVGTSQRIEEGYTKAQNFLNKRLERYGDEKTNLMVGIIMKEPDPQKRIILLTAVLMIKDKAFSKSPQFEQINKNIFQYNNYELSVVIRSISGDSALYDKQNKTMAGTRYGTYDSNLIKTENKYKSEENGNVLEDLKDILKDESADAVQGLRSKGSLVHTDLIGEKFMIRVAPYLSMISGESKNPNDLNLYPNVPNELMAPHRNTYEPKIMEKLTQIQLATQKGDEEKVKTLENELNELIGEFSKKQMETAFKFFQSQILIPLSFNPEKSKALIEKSSLYQQMKGDVQKMFEGNLDEATKKEYQARLLADVFNNPNMDASAKQKFLTDLGLSKSDAEIFQIYAHSENARLHGDLTGEWLTFSDRGEKVVKDLLIEAGLLVATSVADTVTLGALTPAVALRLVSMARLVKAGMMTKTKFLKTAARMIQFSKKQASAAKSIASNTANYEVLKGFKKGALGH